MAVEIELDIISPDTKSGSEQSMGIKDIDIAIIGGIHGDEPSGNYATNKVYEFIKDNSDILQKTIGFVIANPTASNQDTRYIDTDLNRLFTTTDVETLKQRQSETVESQLAPQLARIINIADACLVLHSTNSFSEPFGIAHETMNHHIARSLFYTSLSKVVIHPESLDRGSLTNFDNVLEVESGLQKSESAKENAIKVTKQFLASQYCFTDDSNLMDLQWNDCMAYQLGEKVEKYGDTELYYPNFTTVPQGEVYARSPEQVYKSKGSFTPVLMSETGYQSILGYKGSHIGWLSESDMV